MVTRPRARRLLAALLAGGLLLGGATGPAQATDIPAPPADPGSQIPPVTNGPTNDSGTTATTQAGSCSVVSSPSFLGLSCGDSQMTTRSVKQILGDDPVPVCWDDKLNGAELDALSYQNGESTWYWHRCLKGINPKTKKVQPGGVHFTVELLGIGPGEQVVTLTGNQQQLVNMYSTDGTIPFPVAGVSPSATPRVGGWVSFFDGTDNVVTVRAGAVVLRAHVASIKIEPVGEGTNPALTCNGIGYRAKRGETRLSHPAGCWYRYAASSADQTDNAYPVNITAHWVVEVSSGGGYQPLNEFDKSQVTNVPVTEIEALVVP